MDQVVFEKSKSQPQVHYINVYELNGKWIFVSICIVYLFSTYYLQTSILTEQTYYNSLSGQVAEAEIEEMYNLKQRMGMLSYLFVPVTTFIKILLPSCCLYAASVLLSYKLSFRKALKVSLIAESAFVAATLIRLLILAFFVDIHSFDQLKSFAPLSLFSLLNASSVPPYLTYLLQTINVFEILYCGLLAVGLATVMKLRFKPMLKFAAAAYGAGLFFWIIFIAFLSVTSS